MTRLRIATLVASIGMVCGLSACRQAVEADPAWAAVDLPADPHTVDPGMANAGADLFRTKCTACHYIGGEGGGLGPNLQGVTKRRSQTWMRAMIANPDSMLANDSTAKALLEQYGVRMIGVGAQPAEIRAILEYLWWRDRGQAQDSGGGAGDR